MRTLDPPAATPPPTCASVRATPRPLPASAGTRPISGGFDGEGDLLTLVQGQVGCSLALQFNERGCSAWCKTSTLQHRADQTCAHTVLLGMHSGLFGAFRDLQRRRGGPTVAVAP